MLYGPNLAKDMSRFLIKTITTAHEDSGFDVIPRKSPHGNLNTMLKDKSAAVVGIVDA